MKSFGRYVNMITRLQYFSTSVDVLNATFKFDFHENKTFDGKIRSVISTYFCTRNRTITILYPHCNI